LHGNGYAKVNKVPVRLKTICDIDKARAEKIKATFGFEQIETDFDTMLKDKEIDVVDICTPPMLHTIMAAKAIKAGKHVICEKPLTGYFGQKGDVDPVGEVSKAKMYKAVLADMKKLGKVVATSDRKFMFAENYVYATPIQKAAEILRKKKSKVLMFKGEESLKGSSSAVAGEWKGTGGGTLIRCGTHPLTGILYLKSVEAAARGENITVQSVMADTAFTTKVLSEKEHKYISARPHDVEDFSNLTITFSDGTKAIVIACDTVLGGTKNYVEVYTNDSALMCNITPTDIMNCYFLDEEGLEDVTISEMLPQKKGWNKAFVSDEVIRGYTGELQDFIECVAFDRQPLSNFQLAYDTMAVIYAAYQSSEEGKVIKL
jgi:predicted dehydrogenase